jgi:hypothetical protein
MHWWRCLSADEDEKAGCGSERQEKEHYCSSAVEGKGASMVLVSTTTLLLFLRQRGVGKQRERLYQVRLNSVKENSDTNPLSCSYS